MGRRPMRKYESDEQTALFEWAELQKAVYQELELMYAIPNGGYRNKLEAVNLKRQGVKAGVPDICLPIATRDYCGLYIEMKVKPNKPTENQTIWLGMLQRYGHRVAVCYSWEEAKQIIISYLR